MKRKHSLQAPGSLAPLSLGLALALVLMLPMSPLSSAQSALPLKRDEAKIQRLLATCRAQIGVREKGFNAGIQVEKYLRYAGLAAGQPWCAAFVCWALGEAGIANPRSGWSPALFPASKIIWQRGGQAAQSAGKVQPGPADVFGIYFPEKGRIAHVGFIESRQGDWLLTIEGNTNEAGSREGDGVYRKRRALSSIYRVVRYID